MPRDMISAYHARLAPGDQAICAVLRETISEVLPEAQGRIWHAHPVWFLADNPVVGYSRLRDALRLMFWSGQGFETPGLEATGNFKAAERRYTAVGEIDLGALKAWLAEARAVQWDYKNIVARKGRLERLS